MSVHVVKTVISGNNKGTVTIRSDSLNGAQAIEDLQHADARRLAIQEAQKAGLVGAGISSNAIYHYPVDCKGSPLEKLGGTDPVYYQADIELQGRIF